MVNKKSLATFVRTVGNQVISGFKHFLNNVKIGGDLIIDPNSLGAPATNVLTVDGSGVVKTATAFSGISVDSVSKVKHEVKAGVAINKGQAVYVTGADGTNMIVGLASNASESTSTKTMGLSESTLAINGKGNVVTEGLLDGLNTTAATIGDPVWLGTGGNLIYGLANKPYAPAHLVFIGIVTRVNASNGEIFVKVQNGFELNEIHDVDLKTNVPVNGEILGFNGTLWVNKTIAGWLGYTPANASGTTNYVSKFTGTTTLGDSQIFDNGTNVGIGTTTLTQKFHVNGNIVLGDVLYLNSANGAIWNSANGALRFGTNATERARFDAAGNFGIGTASPLSKLHVETSASNPFRMVRTGGSATNFGYEFGSGAIGLYDYTNSTYRYYITSGGNVGIGTTSPAANLHVATAGTTGSTSMFLISRASGYGHTLFEQTYDSTYFTAGKTLTLKNDSGTAFAHFAGNNAGTVTNFLLPSGSVGIGTTSPGYALDVIARASGEGGVRFWNNRAASSTVDSVAIHLNVSNTVGMTGGKIVVAENTNDAWPTNMQFYINSASSSYSPVEAMRITSAGNVGIGTTSPGAKLNVSGGFIRVEGTSTDQYFLEGVRTGVSTTLRIYDNSSVPFYDSYGSMYFRANQNGGSGGIIGLFGGNVGIGTTSPLQLLHVAGLAYFGSDIFGAVNNGIFFSGNNSYNAGIYGRNSGSDLVLQGGGSERMRIVSSGNVGIGTTSPTVALDVNGTINGGFLTINRAETSAIFTDTRTNIHTTTPSFKVQNTGDTSVTTLSHRLVDLDYAGDADTVTGTYVRFLTGGTERAGLGLTSDKFTITTGVAERLTIDSTGNVGIGTTSPSAKLHVSGGGQYISASASATAFLRLYSNAQTSSQFEIGQGFATTTDNIAYLWNVANASMVFGTNSSERLRITSAGNVGIGTTSPISLLHVYGSNARNLIQDAGAGYPHVQLNNSSGNFYLSIDNSAGTGFGSAYGRYLYSEGAYPMILVTNSAERMRITSAGNVGIGTTSPSEKLSVVGGNISLGAGYKLQYSSTAYITPENNVSGAEIATGGVLTIKTGGTTERVRVDASGNVGIGTVNPGAKLDVVGSAGIRVNEDGIGTKVISIRSNFAGVDPAINVITNNALLLQTNNTERMRIDSSGNVGIGTTSPGARLDVSGIARATSLSTVSGLGLNVAGYAYLSQTISGAMTLLGHNVRASDSVANTAIVQNAGWISSLIKMYYNEGITFHTDSTVYAAGATYPLATTERMRIQVNGNVGIGTASPWSRFTVSGALSASTSQISIVNTEGGHSIIRAGISGVTNNGMSFVTANVDGSSQNVRMVVGATGNVGIGTTSTTSKLHVLLNGNTSGGPTGNVASFQNSSVGSNAYVTLFGAYNAEAGIVFTDESEQFKGKIGYNNNSEYMYFQTDGSEKVRITAAGNVGIGTTSPAASLHIGANGGVIFGATAGAVGTAQITTTSATSPVSTRFAFGTDGTGWQYRIAKNTAGTIIDLVTVADNGRVGIGTTSPSTLLHVEGRIYAGDIGIATTSPTQKLHVVGNARITGAIFDSLNSSGTAGQVLSSTGTGTEWVTGGGGGGSTIIVKDEGTTVGSSFTTLDFYGSNIQASASGSTAVITALNNAGTGSVYSNDTTAQYAPTASFADVEINTVTVEAAAPDTAGTGQKLIATITFGVDNVSDFDGFNNFDFRLYNSSASSAIADTTHSWCSYMSKGEFEKRTVFTFHIPLYDGVGGSDVVTVQAKQSTAYTPEIYYCALTLIEGTN